MNRKFKTTKHLFLIEIFCNIINVFIVIFCQFNASLLNESINFYQNNLYCLFYLFLFFYFSQMFFFF